MFVKSGRVHFNRFETNGTRKVLIRTGIVLGKDGGPLKPLKMLVKFGLGGRQGPGNQYFSWLHEKDFVRIIDFIIANPNMNGTYNVTAPMPADNSHIMKALRNAVGMPFAIPLPKWLLEFGAVLIGTETELVLKSRKVIPKRLLEAGYSFQFAKLEINNRSLLITLGSAAWISIYVTALCFSAHSNPSGNS